MAKSKKKQKKMLKLVFTCLEVLFALAAICMIFVPTLGIKDTDTAFYGVNAVFGYSQVNSFAIIKTEIQVLSFSFLNFLTYLLVLIAVVLLILKLAVPKQAKLINILSVVLLVVAGVFFFLVIQFTVVADGFKTIYNIFGSDPKSSLTLGIGAILGGAFAFVSALTAIFEIAIAD